MAKYKVGYMAEDGTKCSFTMESNRRIGHTTYNNTPCCTPILEDVIAKRDEIMKREDSAMKRHGGYKYLRYIKNTSTGYTLIYAD